MALEALAKYSAQNNDVEDLNLRVEMCHENGKREGIRLTQQNALTQSAIEASKMALFLLPHL